MIKIETWDAEKAKKELSKRFNEAKDARKMLESQWLLNEKTVFTTRAGNFGPNLTTDGTQISATTSQEDLTPGGDSTGLINVNYIMRDVRFIHSQISSNPPSVVPRPATADVTDRRKADAADRCIRHAMRKYKMQDKFDQAALWAVVNGTTFCKSFHNPTKGEIIDFDESKGEITLEGDFDFYVPAIWNIFPEPCAKWEDVRYVFERFYLPWEEAIMLVGSDKEEILKKHVVQEDEDEIEGSRSRLVGKVRKGLVRIFQYWEKGLPYNGMQGRFCWCTSCGTPLTPIKPNPHKFGGTNSNGKKSPIETARLPYHIWTDIDVPNTYWGQSIVSYSLELQNAINQVDNVTMDNLRAHGVARLILPEGSEVKDDSITNSPWDIVRITGNQPPHFMEPMPLPASMTQIRQQLSADIMEVNGVNENVFGKQSREQSGFSMQYATEQSNMMRRRLFNKYVNIVEEVYKDYIDIVVKHWTEPKLIKVLGKEKAFESVELKGSDIDGGYDLVVEYGTSLPLDPLMRRQELIQMQPIFEKAGMPPKTYLSLFKLNELDRAYDMQSLSEERQKEIIDEMIGSGQYIPPEELQEHKGMLEYAYGYIMTAEFKYLEPNIKELIRQHVKEREQLAAQGAATPEATEEAAASPAGPTSLMDMLAGG